MSKMISFWLLVAVIVILVIVFFQVMSSFILPLFLAVVLVVIFNPLHKWILRKLKGRKRTAAALTTIAVMSIVLLPIGLLVTFAAIEGRQLVKQTDSTTLLSKLREIRTRFGLDIKHAEEIQELESQLQSAFDRSNQRTQLDNEAAEYLAIDLEQVDRSAEKLAGELSLPWPYDPTLTYEDESLLHQQWCSFALEFNYSRATLDDLESDPSVSGKTVGKQVAKTVKEFRNFKSTLMGGSLRAAVAEFANPTDDELTSYSSGMVEWSQKRIVSFGGATLGFLAKLVIGVIIMVVAVYFFLLDGPGMLASIKKLSPLDDGYEDELIDEFDRISRAVVVAALLSAVVQGILAGFGYWIAGLGSVFLLTLLTMMFALIPFVGTSLVWAPCCVYLYLFEGRLWPAILLAVFGMVVVSQADNFIKPMVLHGQSKIHPLLALLSILGGVATLGPIGILVGPMVVAFLQTLLKILQRELTKMDNDHSTVRGAEIT